MISAATGLRLDVVSDMAGHDIWINLLPVDAARRHVEANPQRFPLFPDHAAIMSAVCFSTVQSDPRRAQTQTSITRAVLYIPSDLGGEIMRRCLAENLSEALGFTSHAKPVGDRLQDDAMPDAHTLRHLAILAGNRLKPAMTRDQARAVLGFDRR